MEVSIIYIMQSKSMDWFLYDRDLRYERFNVSDGHVLKTFYSKIKRFVKMLIGSNLGLIRSHNSTLLTLWKNQNLRH